MVPLRRENGMNRKAIILILFLVALGVRLIALKQNYVVAPDGILYIKMAQLYLTGQYHHEIFGNYPYYAFFPLLILPFYKVVGNWVLAGQWVSVLCGALTVIPLYLLARGIFDEKIALWSAVFYIICPTLVRYSAEVLRDIPFIVFYTAALWWGYKGIKDEKVVFWGLAGLSIAFSAFLRIEGLALLVSLPMFLFWYGFKNDISWKKTITACSVILASTFCLLALFGLFLTEKGVRISTAQIGKARSALISMENKTIGNIEKEVEDKDISQPGKEFFHIARENRIVLYFSHIFFKTVKVFNVLFLLFLFGLIKRRVINYRQDEFLLFAIYSVFVMVFFLYLNASNYLSTRHPFPLVVPSLIWVGVGFVELKERVILWLKGRDFPLRDQALRWVVPILVIVICTSLLSMAWVPNRRDKLELKEIGLWLRDHGYANSIIIGQHEFSRLAFYANGEFIYLPKGNYQDIVRFAREKKARLLVVNKETIEDFAPHFFDMVSPRDLQQIDIPGIATPHYATTVFQVEVRGEK